MRPDDDMPGEGFYELYRVLFYPGFTRSLQPECGMCDGSSEPFAKWGPKTGILSLRRWRWRKG